MRGSRAWVSQERGHLRDERRFRSATAPARIQGKSLLDLPRKRCSKQKQSSAGSNQPFRELQLSGPCVSGAEGWKGREKCPGPTPSFRRTRASSQSSQRAPGPRRHVAPGTATLQSPARLPTSQQAFVSSSALLVPAAECFIIRYLEGTHRARPPSPAMRRP